MRYLLDANIFIEAKNRYYAYDICPGFWRWLDRVQLDGSVASITAVYDELADKEDELAEWIKRRRDSGFFLEVNDSATQQCYIDIVTRVQAADYTEAAKSDFFKGADPWLIAKAKVLNASVVTHEGYNPDAKRKVYIPNICRQFSVSYQDTFSLLRKLSASFVLP